MKVEISGPIKQRPPTQRANALKAPHRAFIKAAINSTVSPSAWIWVNKDIYLNLFPILRIICNCSLLFDNWIFSFAIIIMLLCPLLELNKKGRSQAEQKKACNYSCPIGRLSVGWPRVFTRLEMKALGHLGRLESIEVTGSPNNLEFATMWKARSELRPRSVPGYRGQSEKGQALVEAAMVLPLLLFIIFAVIDFSILFYVYQSMEYGISEATRYGITGQQREDPNNPGDYLSQEDSIKLAMRECNPTIALDNSSFTFEHLVGASWAAGSGGPNDISRVTVNYNWRPMTPLVSVLFAGGQLPLRVSSTMKNEGYPTP